MERLREKIKGFIDLQYCTCIMQDRVDVLRYEYPDSCIKNKFLAMPLLDLNAGPFWEEVQLFKIKKVSDTFTKCLFGINDIYPDIPQPFYFEIGANPVLLSRMKEAGFKTDFSEGEKEITQPPDIFILMYVGMNKGNDKTKPFHDFKVIYIGRNEKK